MIDRSPYYKNLNIEQIQVADALTEPAFESWVKSGCSKYFLNQVLENNHAHEHVGQVPPSSKAASTRVDGKPPVTTAENPNYPKIGEFGLDLQPNRKPTSYDIEAADDAFKKFCSRYQQLVVNESNAGKIYTFLASRGAVCNAKNLTIAFEKLWGNLELRSVEKRVHEPVTKLTNRKGQRVPVMTYFPRPTTAELVETIYTPDQVRGMPADQTAKFLAPMQFVRLASSASDYLQSEEFRSETPVPTTRSSREQSPAQVSREVKLFAAAYPQFGTYLGQPEKYQGLYETVLGFIAGWGLLVDAQSLLDAFNRCAHEGIIPKLDDKADGQISTFHTTPDVRPHWTKTSVAKAVREFTAAEFQAALNSDPEFRALVDSTA